MVAIIGVAVIGLTAKPVIEVMGGYNKPQCDDYQSSMPLMYGLFSH